MLFMVIEHFKNRDAPSVYRRFRNRRRMAPADLRYAGSWVETNFDRCFRLVECDAKGAAQVPGKGSLGRKRCFPAGEMGGALAGPSRI